jgi:phosphonate transport system substrate-binding protein
MNSTERTVVGAVAYHPRVVTIWESFCVYFARRGVLVDYVLYSNYERLVNAVLDGDVHLGWNTNTAFVSLERKLGAEAQILGMRDLDAEFATVIVTRRGQEFDSPTALTGRTLALGSRDAGHTAILPLYFLEQQGLPATSSCRLLRFDSDIGKHGDTGNSELAVVQAVAEGEADAGAIGAPTWARFRAEGLPATAGLAISWCSPTYYHCNFTALPSLEVERAARWQTALLEMSFDDPAVRPAMTLEGVHRWLPGDRAGYESLRAAMRMQAQGDSAAR